MKWYRVKPEFDNHKATRNTRKGQKITITPATEQAFYAMLELVEIPRNRVAWVFGGAFCAGQLRGGAINA